VPIYFSRKKIRRVAYYCPPLMPRLKLRRGRPRSSAGPRVGHRDAARRRHRPLTAVDVDLGRAIVSVVDRAPRPPRASAARTAASLASYGRHAVILVPPVHALRRLHGVQLVPVGNGRALIALDHPHGVPELELDLRDALDRRRAQDPGSDGAGKLWRRSCGTRVSRTC
jgi:hypothetical protein